MNLKILKLVRLYLAYHMNKITILVFTIILAIWAIVAYINIGEVSNIEYLSSFNQIHFTYFEESIFFMQIINGVLVIFLVAAETFSFANFDAMLVANTKRSMLIFAKILANIIIMVILVTFEVLILYLLALWQFPYYILKAKAFLMIIYLLMPILELLLFSEIISLLIKSFFTPIIVFIFYLLMLILSKIESLSDTINKIIPMPKIYEVNKPVIQGDYAIYISICLLLLIALLLIFQKKDLK